MGRRAGKKIKVVAVPSAVARAAGAVASRFIPLIKDLAAMFHWFETGRYVAEPSHQEQLFGPVPTAEEALARFTDEPRTAPHRTGDRSASRPSPPGGLTRMPRARPSWSRTTPRPFRPSRTGDGARAQGSLSRDEGARSPAMAGLHRVSPIDDQMSAPD